MVTNQQVSDLLNRIADLLDIRGDTFFKTRAYRMAAQKIEVLDDDINQLVQEQRLETIDGVGDALAKKISEYVTSGSLTFYEKLTQEIPESLLDLLDIQGLGPKKVAILFNKLHITTIPQLRSACEKGSLRDLEGFGEITERNILRGITLKEKTSGRVLLHIAYENGVAYQTYMRTCPKVKKISIAGSLRRMKETIGDIDLLVSSNDAEPVMKWFIDYEYVDRILMHGPTKSSVLLTDNVQVDLRVVEPKSFGAALQYFTGSKEHNVTMRGLAIKKGYKLNEYGVFSQKNHQFLMGENEQQIYGLLGLQYIPPELRENRNEIHIASQQQLPQILTYEDIQGDLHVHSTWSDGTHSLEEMAQSAKQQNYTFVGLTDHSQSLQIANGLSPERVTKKCATIQQLNKKLAPFNVLCGTECDIKPDGSLDYPPSVLKQFDFVYLGIHTHFSMTDKEMTTRILTGLDHEYVDFLAHPTCRMIGRRRGFNIDMEKIIEKAKERNIALEINAFPDRLDLNDIHAKQTRDHQVPLVIGTDSHNKQHLPFMRYGIATARRAWCTKNDIINSWNLKKIRTWLGKKR